MRAPDYPQDLSQICETTQVFGWWMSILHMTKTKTRIMYIPIAQVVVDSSHLLLVVQAANLFTDPPQICEGKVRQLE